MIQPQGGSPHSRLGRRGAGLHTHGVSVHRGPTGRWGLQWGASVRIRTGVTWRNMANDLRTQTLSKAERGGWDADVGADDHRWARAHRWAHAPTCTEGDGAIRLLFLGRKQGICACESILNQFTYTEKTTQTMRLLQNEAISLLGRHQKLLLLSHF